MWDFCENDLAGFFAKTGFGKLKTGQEPRQRPSLEEGSKKLDDILVKERVFVSYKEPCSFTVIPDLVTQTLCCEKAKTHGEESLF